jgi:hypothetical protein
VRFVINVYVFCSANIQQTATKGVNFRLFGADLSFLGCDVTLSSLVGVNELYRRICCSRFQSGRVKNSCFFYFKEEGSKFLRNVPNYTALYCRSANLYVCQQYVQCIDISEVVHPWVLLNSRLCTCIDT